MTTLLVRTSTRIKSQRRRQALELSHGPQSYIHRSIAPPTSRRSKTPRGVPESTQSPNETPLFESSGPLRQPPVDTHPPAGTFDNRNSLRPEATDKKHRQCAKSSRRSTPAAITAPSASRCASPSAQDAASVSAWPSSTSASARSVPAASAPRDGCWRGQERRLLLPSPSESERGALPPSAWVRSEIKLPSDHAATLIPFLPVLALGLQSLDPAGSANPAPTYGPALSFATATASGWSDKEGLEWVRIFLFLLSRLAFFPFRTSRPHDTRLGRMLSHFLLSDISLRKICMIPLGVEYGTFLCFHLSVSLLCFQSVSSFCFSSLHR